MKDTSKLIAIGQRIKQQQATREQSRVVKPKKPLTLQELTVLVGDANAALQAEADGIMTRKEASTIIKDITRTIEGGL